VSLKEELQEIDGVGEATAEKIVSVVGEQEPEGIDKREIERVNELLERGSYRVAQSRIEGLL
jgi:DNA uptake protein ComE-like DNA-binding protein